MKRNEIYEECNDILNLAIEYGEAQRNIERQLYNEEREEPIEQTIKYSHDMYIVLTNAIWDFARKVEDEITKKKKEAEETD